MTAQTVQCFIVEQHALFPLRLCTQFLVSNSCIEFDCVSLYYHWKWTIVSLFQKQTVHCSVLLFFDQIKANCLKDSLALQLVSTHNYWAMFAHLTLRPFVTCLSLFQMRWSSNGSVLLLKRLCTHHKHFALLFLFSMYFLVWLKSICS
jgi:hypothetical protein